jgi:hypothetical protein
MIPMAGEHEMWVTGQMGHAVWSLTAKRYARWLVLEIPDADKHPVERTTRRKPVETIMPKGGLEPPTANPESIA